MYIDGEFETNNDVAKGTEAHEKAARRSDRIDVIEDIPGFEPPPRNLIFHSEGLMLSGTLDAIKQRDGEWIPFEAKKSSAPDSQRPQHWHGFMLTPGTCPGSYGELPAIDCGQYCYSCYKHKDAVD